MSNQTTPVRHSPVLAAQPVRGILKRPASHQQHDERAPRLKWDEENLTITEAQKDSTMKIDEPKTPYVHYNHELDKVMDMDDAFLLDDNKKKTVALAHTPPVSSYMKGSDDDDEEDADDQEDDGPEEWQDSDEEDEDEDEAPHEKIDHDKFAKMRAEHYKMKEALQLGHELAEEELAALDSPNPSSAPVPPLPSFARQSNADLRGPLDRTGPSNNKGEHSNMEL
ncbi:hypothetical protein BC939DRAFT_444365 [Gamsiella multidivaricata]|uniref:uncharacterized protein n=1 Tax=Gamsiella multidivaricata TaxID=101098 RepID=UPI00221F2BD4|nr:uncharacterized protein BC939DRAFT_444365 [Gamsiella multidivaricata]KAG0362623.1 hypothetical protein BGZ54_008560 [Gamsiella multidivaricata]KAI7828037.1 hypothetical protein BC939DRAFT_444365 [Gamsiella multidivaricata]